MRYTILLSIAALTLNCGGSQRTVPLSPSPIGTDTFTLMGHVVDESNAHPIAGVIVDVYDGRSHQTAITDENGAYSCAGSAVREAIVTVSKAPFSPQQIHIDLDGTVTREFQLAMPAGRTPSHHDT